MLVNVHALCLGFVVERDEANGGNLCFTSYQSLEETFAKKV